MSTPSPPPYELGWNGVPLHGSPTRPIGLDTETTVCDDPAAVATLALVSACDGRRCVLIHPTQLAGFLQAHPGAHFVWHNFAYDFWVIESYLAEHHPGLVPGWYRSVDENRQHDTQYLDMLVRLAEGRGEGGEDSERFYPRNLGEVAREYAGLTIDKADPYRMRYGELVGQSLEDWKKNPEPGFWSYAASDAYAVWAAWGPLAQRARALQRRFAAGLPAAVTARWDAWGLLTEQIQVRGSLALAKIERNGLPYDPARAAADRAVWMDKLTDVLAEMDPLYPGLFKRDKNGRYIRAKKSGAPSLNQQVLTQLLSAAADEIRAHVPDFVPPEAQGKTKHLISKSHPDWAPYERFAPFIARWGRLEQAAKRLEFHALFAPAEPSLFDGERAYRIHPRYQTLVRTGRTSSTNPNTQNLPRDKEFRSIFTAPAGKQLVTTDYAYVELRTLAATTLAFQGKSVLAQVMRTTDPHVYTAAMIQGLSLEQFTALKGTDPGKFKQGRQAAKALNFGIPGGLGADKLVWYAQATYGVTLTRDEAEEFRHKVIREVYPELSDRGGYLGDSFLPSLAMNTGLGVGEITHLLEHTVLTNRDGSPGKLAALPPWLPRVLAKIAGGKRTKANSDPYDRDFLERCLSFLEGVGRRAPSDGPLTPHARGKLLARMPDERAARELFLGHGVTVTGRVRANVTYTKEKNTPFQGLAADGAKLALWELVKREREHPGFKVVAFVHDEVVSEVPVGEFTGEQWARSVEGVMNSQMERVLYGVPSGTESHVSSHWEK